MDLSLEMVEMRDEKSGSGMRSLDILASLPDGTRVAIENQYGEGDHDHLTRGLAYAVNLDCPILIVVAENHKPEFRAVADYLNRIAENDDDAIAVFLVRFGLLEAADGSRFPQIEIQAEPNEFRAQNQVRIDQAASSKQQQLSKYWDVILPALKDSPLFGRSRPTGKSTWIGERTPVTGLDWQLRVRAEQTQLLLYASHSSGEYNEQLLLQLEADRQAVEARFGEGLTWDIMEGAKDAKVFATAAGGYKTEALDPEPVRSNVERFHSAFADFLPGLADFADDLDLADEYEWDGQTYVFTLGEGEHRNWEDCRRFGFLSAGGSDWHVRTTRQLSSGDRVYVSIPKAGYVGVGVVLEAATPADEASVVVDNHEVPLSEIALSSDASEETIVTVRWETTVGVADAVWRDGMRANQNTVWRLQHPFTIEQLTEAFGTPAPEVER